MRCLYREKMHKCGDYLEIDIYPVFAPPRSVRSRKAKPTKEVQKLLNQRNAERQLIRIANTNFTENDLCFTLTYDDDHVTTNLDAAQNDIRNYIRRVRRLRRKKGLPELKYIYVTEQGSKSGRIHHHIIMSGGVLVNDLAKKWGMGITQAKPLQFNEKTGIAALAAYLVKSPATQHRWYPSQNLEKPKTSQRDGKISARKVKELHDLNTSAAAEYETRYPGYLFADAKVVYNDCNGGVYLSVFMYKSKERKRSSA